MTDTANTGATMSAAGTGAEAFAALAQGILAHNRASKIADYNAKVAEANAQAQAQAAQIEALQYDRQAQLSREDAVLLRQAQTWREARQGEQQAAVLGQTRAIIAASGLQMEGSPLAVYEETLRQHSLDTLAQRYQTRVQERAVGEQATQQAYAATMARYGGGERLRIGGQQAGLIQATVDDTQIAAGLTKVSGDLLKGAATYEYLTTRQKASLSPSEPSLLGR
jgi:hypothetical protein